uniref:Acetyl-CoA acetyltransferase, cytosolic n=1 Tax=Strigamia maritima TaxID=126957 RepID=T1IVJ0_STRMM
MNQSVYIVAASRTPIGSFNGCLSGLSAAELGSTVIEDVVKRALINTSDVSEVIVGQVYTAGQGQNPARQASLKAGIPHDVPAWGVNMLCGSGLKAIALGVQSIKCGDADLIIAGGQESMSQTPHATCMRAGTKMGNVVAVDTLIKDGLQDAFIDCHMGVTAENIVKIYNVSREAQDIFAYKSQQKTEVAINSGYFNREIVPVTIPGKKGNSEISKDEYPRSGCTLESLGRLKPCFILTGEGTVTPGNASGINDGAAAVVLASEDKLRRDANVQKLCRIVSWAQVGVLPNIMGMGPVTAIQAALKKAKWSIDEVDLYELNEAFAAQSIAVLQELSIDSNKVNINGGAIALGHPLGASGARVLVTLIYALQRTGGKKGVAALCIGGGQGIAMCIEVA